MKKRFNWKVLFGVLIILVVLVVIYLILTKRNTLQSILNFKPRIFDSEEKYSSLLPNFDTIHKTAERNDEKWVAAGTAIRIKNGKVKFYTQLDGLTGSAIDVTNHKNQIWVGMHGGVAKYNDQTDKFDPHLTGESNSRFFEDPYAKKLYLTTFKHVYIYDDDKNEWDEIRDGDGPNNTQQMILIL